MPKVKYRPQNRFGQRFLTARELGGYAEDLQLTETALSEGYLEFFEQERLLIPICRLRYPAEIVRKFALEQYSAENDPVDHSPSLPIETDAARLNAAAELERQIWTWPMHVVVGETLRHHPLDHIDPLHFEFIEQDIAERPFQPWETFKVMVGDYRGSPVYENAVTTYYRYWQVFWLAEILAMRISVSVNLLDEDIQSKAMRGQLHKIPAQRQRGTVYLGGLPTLREFPHYQPAFEALAYFWAYRECALQLAGKGLQGPHPRRLTGTRLDTFRAQERAMAIEAIGRWGIDAHALADFLKWQCQRWQEWERRGYRGMTEEYRSHISRTAYLYSVLTGRNADQVTREIGDITGHARPTLEVILPDRIKEQKSIAAQSLRSWIKPSMASMAPIAYDISDAECDEPLDWIERQKLLQFFWHFQRLDELGHQDDLISRMGFAKEIEGLCSTVEHLLNEMLPSHMQAGTMYPKLQTLWDDIPQVSDGLYKKKKLTSLYNTNLPQQMAKITAVTVGGVYSEIVRDLLKTSLIRNQGIHLSLRGFDREELFQLLEVILRSAVLMWKHAKKRGFIRHFQYLS